MNIRENVDEGLRSIQSNLLRTVLTAMIIAIGITSLVGILTAIEGIQNSVNSSFADLGANTFTVENYVDEGFRRGGRRGKVYSVINYQEASDFSRRFRSEFGGTVSLSSNIGGAVQVNYLSKKTNPNINEPGQTNRFWQ